MSDMLTHTGHIMVHSEVGKGTTFQVYLPLIKKLSADLPEETVEPLTGGTETVNFLINSIWSSPGFRARKHVQRKQGRKLGPVPGIFQDVIFGCRVFFLDENTHAG